MTLHDRCHVFSLAVIAVIDQFPSKRSAWVIGDQLLRSATSVGANLVEGRASSSRLEFKKYNEIALKSANETKYWLGLLRDTRLIPEAKVAPLLNEAVELANMIASGFLKIKHKL